jgi:hypothetical protein
MLGNILTVGKKAKNKSIQNMLRNILTVGNTAKNKTIQNMLGNILTVGNTALLGMADALGKNAKNKSIQNMLGDTRRNIGINQTNAKRLNTRNKTENLYLNSINKNQIHCLLPLLYNLINYLFFLLLLLLFFFFSFLPLYQPILQI